MNREQRRNGVIERRIEEAAEAILEYGDVKVDEQANGESHELEIRNDLRLVNRKQALNRLDFEDQAALHHEVEAISPVEGKALVVQRNLDLAVCAQSAQAKLVRHATLVSRLQEPRPEVTVDLDACGDDPSGQFIQPLLLCSSLFHFWVLGAG